MWKEQALLLFMVTCLRRLAECSFDLHVSKFSFQSFPGVQLIYEQNDHVLRNAILRHIGDFLMVETSVKYSFSMECTSSMSQEKKFCQKDGQGYKPQANQVSNSYSIGGKEKNSNIVEIYF